MGVLTGGTYSWEWLSLDPARFEWGRLPEFEQDTSIEPSRPSLQRAEVAAPSGRRRRMPDAWAGLARWVATRVQGRSRRMGLRSVATRQGHERPARLRWDELRADGHLRRMWSAPEHPPGRLRQEVPRPAATGRMDPCPSGWGTGDGDSRDRDRLFARLPLEGATDPPRTPRSTARAAASRGLSPEGRVGEVDRPLSARDLRSPVSKPVRPAEWLDDVVGRQGHDRWSVLRRMDSDDRTALGEGEVPIGGVLGHDIRVGRSCLRRKYRAVPRV
jgi:hypothetical protein